jgi:hypothetical protein
VGGRSVGWKKRKADGRRCYQLRQEQNGKRIDESWKRRKSTITTLKREKRKEKRGMTQTLSQMMRQ